MLSYRHAFHAGNHADVLKHCVLVQLLRYLTQKDKPLWFVDTHAGAGIYALDGDYAKTSAEFETGIARLWPQTNLPAPLEDYVEIVRVMNPGAVLRRYPGSPQIALQLLRQRDRLRLIEMHTTESALLQRYAADAGARVLAQAGDGFTALQTFLPPPSRRALILIDPSYEDKQDYRRVIDTLRQALKRFADGCYAIWYPLVQRAEPRKLLPLLKQLGMNDWLHVSLTVKAPAPGGLGLHGSGMFVIHPSFTLPQTLQSVMPYLVKTLGQDERATYALEYQLT